MTTLEFSAVRASVAQAVKQAEQARALRIESIDRQLPTLEADLMTKQQEVAALRAERERLQAQTGAQIVAEMAGEGGEKREQKQDEPFIPGLPDKRLREVWAEWEDKEGDVATFKGERYRYSSWPSSDADQLIGDGSEWSSQYPLRPHGATWEHVKRLAEKKESGPLKVGDRVEVPDGVRELVHEGAIPPGQYEVTRVWDDDVEMQRGSVRYLVRDSDARRV